MLATRIASIWGAALLCGWFLRTIIPTRWGISWTGKHVGYVFDFNRLAFWLCLLVGAALSIVPLVRAFLRDFPFLRR